MIAFTAMVQRAARYGPGDFVHFRTDKGLVDDLDAMVLQLRDQGIKGVTRSSVARTLLRQGLDQDPTGGEVREVMSNVYRATQIAMGQFPWPSGPWKKAWRCLA